LVTMTIADPPLGLSYFSLPPHWNQPPPLGSCGTNLRGSTLTFLTRTPAFPVPDGLKSTAQQLQLSVSGDLIVAANSQKWFFPTLRSSSSSAAVRTWYCSLFYFCAVRVNAPHTLKPTSTPRVNPTDYSTQGGKEGQRWSWSPTKYNSTRTSLFSPASADDRLNG